MTVIAANRKMICGDTQMSCGSLASKGIKVFEVEDAIVGIAGDTSDQQPFLEWYEHGGDKPSLAENFNALVLTKKGKLIEYEDKLFPLDVVEKYHAIGNGSHFALGAMSAGATPEQAVKLTCKRIDGCGLPVTTKVIDG